MVEPLRDLAQELINDDKATQHSKLNGLLKYSIHLDVRMDNQADRMDSIQHDVNSNPLGWLPAKWRTKVAGVAGFWLVWVSLNVAGYTISIPAIIDAIKPYIP